MILATVTYSTYSLSVGAANGVGSAGIAATNTDDAERRAVQAEKTSEVAEHDAKKTGKDVGRRGGALFKKCQEGENSMYRGANNSRRR